jgi:hypothetical protein
MTQTPSRALMALFLAAGLGVGLVASAHAASSAKASEEPASAPAAAARPETSPLLKAAQERIAASDWVAALAKLKEVEAVGNLTPYEAYLVSRYRAVASYYSKDPNTAIREFQSAIASPFVTTEKDRLSLTEVLIQILFDEKHYPEALAWIDKYQKAGGAKVSVIELVPLAQYFSDDYKNAAVGFQKQLDAEKAAGRKPTERLFRLIASAQTKAEDEAGYARTVDALAEAYPKREYVAMLVNRAARAPGVDKLRLDSMRQHATILGYSAKEGDMKLTHAYLAARGGYPAEAKPMFDEGLASKSFSAGDIADATKTRDQNARSINQDRATDKANEASARSAKEGDALVNYGLEVFFDGQTERGLALMDAGLQKGNLKKADEAKLHYGMALVKVGRFDDARKVLEPLSGNEGVGALAKVWAFWARIGGKFDETGGAAPAAPPAASAASAAKG